jgi:hypothetical protein
VVTASVLAATLCAAPALSAQGTAGKLRTTSPQVASGASIHFLGTLPTDVRRSIALQRRTPSGWTAAGWDRTSESGKIDVVAFAPTVSGRYVYRVKAARLATPTGTLPQVKTPEVIVVVAPSAAANTGGDD